MSKFLAPIPSRTCRLAGKVYGSRRCNFCWANEKEAYDGYSEVFGYRGYTYTRFNGWRTGGAVCHLCDPPEEIVDRTEELHLEMMESRRPPSFGVATLQELCWRIITPDEIERLPVALVRICYHEDFIPRSVLHRCLFLSAEHRSAVASAPSEKIESYPDNDCK